MSYTVYMHIAPSRKVYIGITSKHPEERWQNGKGYRGNKHFTFAIQKYGWKHFSHKILFTGLTKEEAEAKEIELIAFYHSTDPDYGYNIANGGMCAGSLSDETKIKIGLAHKGKVLSEEQKKKISASLIGKTHSEETKRKIGQAHLGNTWSLGVVRSKETKEKISNAHKGKKHSAEHNKHMGESHMHPVLCIETGIVYCSIKSAAEKTGINKNCISHACNGRNKSAGGFHWMFADVRCAV